MTKLFLISALMTLSLSVLADPPAANGLGEAEADVAASLPVEGCTVRVSGSTLAPSDPRPAIQPGNNGGQGLGM
jgi:hypothetical protein